MENPLVSIIIPVYNGSNYVREAIDSAIAQTYKNIEIIVVNDGSKDNGATEEICLSYGDKIRYICKENGGVSSALNVGIREMKGQFFSWLSHDDKYEPDKIEKQINCLNQNGNRTHVLLCECKQIDSDGNEIKNSLKKDYFPSCGVYSAEKVLENLFRYKTFFGCAFLIRKDVFDKCGLFDERLRYSQDFLMWSKIFLSRFDLAYNKDISVCCRIHNKQLTQTGKALFYKDSCEIAKEITPLILQNFKEKNNLLYFFIRRQAILNCVEAFNTGMQYANKFNILSFYEKIMLKAIKLYGRIRPSIRRFYYRVFKGVITQ